MKLFMHPSNESKQLKSERFPLDLAYHPVKGWYKIIYQGLILPDLPSPLHYFNFKALTGQPNIPILRNQSAISTNPLDTVFVLSSSSPQMTGHIHNYSQQNECHFKDTLFQFGEKQQLSGAFPRFHLQRNDDELQVNLNIETQPIIHQFNRLKIGIYDHWSLLCQCQGSIRYKNQTFEINHQGAFEYARAINVPYLPICFYTYQMIHLKNQQQLILIQLKNQFNQIIQSRMYLRSADHKPSIFIDEQVSFNVHRVYPKVTTPNQQEMYLPREFEWEVKHAEYDIHLYGRSRGDFKFGLGAGYVGSFCYQLTINNEVEEGSAGYCEYIDVRPLLWQEQNDDEKNNNKIANIAPIALKNR